MIKNKSSPLPDVARTKQSELSAFASLGDGT